MLLGDLVLPKDVRKLKDMPVVHSVPHLQLVRTSEDNGR
jgi:hypothetical protein